MGDERLTETIIVHLVSLPEADKLRQAARYRACDSPRARVLYHFWMWAASQPPAGAIIRAVPNARDDQPDRDC